MTRRRRAVGAGIAVLAGLALAGCGSSGSVAETRDGRVTVHGRGDRATATIQGDGSTVTYGTGSVPGQFPSSVPLPEGASLGTTAAATRAARRFFHLTYVPAAPASRALATYGTRLTNAGFRVSDGAGASIDATDGTWKVRAIAGSGTEPTLAVTVSNA